MKIDTRNKSSIKTSNSILVPEKNWHIRSKRNRCWTKCAALCKSPDGEKISWSQKAKDLSCCMQRWCDLCHHLVTLHTRSHIHEKVIWSQFSSGWTWRRWGKKTKYINFLPRFTAFLYIQRTAWSNRLNHNKSRKTLGEKRKIENNLTRERTIGSFSLLAIVLRIPKKRKEEHKKLTPYAIWQKKPEWKNNEAQRRQKE